MARTTGVQARHMLMARTTGVQARHMLMARTTGVQARHMLMARTTGVQARHMLMARTTGVQARHMLMARTTGVQARHMLMARTTGVQARRLNMVIGERRAGRGQPERRRGDEPGHYAPQATRSQKLGALTVRRVCGWVCHRTIPHSLDVGFAITLLWPPVASTFAPAPTSAGKYTQIHL